MGFVKNLLGRFKSKKTKHEEVDTIQKESLDYNDNLINMLKNDHQTLFELYGDIQKQFEKDNDFEKMKICINDFKLALEIHLMVEDTQLYGYIKRTNENNVMISEFIDDVQHEMESIATEAMIFIKKYTDHKLYDENLDNFLEDLGGIGTVLTKRIEMEEKRLYTLYQP